VAAVFPVIIGPTAGGKSALAVEVALRLAQRGAPGEVVSADSVQVYRGMDIGSAKPTAETRRGVPHHLIDVAEPTEPFSVERWLALASAAIADIRARGRTPVVVGGTHLYVKALLEGLFEGPAPDPVLRARLTAMPSGERRAMLERVDPDAAARIHPNDARRTVRALEVHEQTGSPISALQTQWDRGARSDAMVAALAWPVEAINRRINARVGEMLRAGLLEEVRALWKAGRLGQQAREALGYKQFIAHLEGVVTLEEATEAVKIESRRFAKNQRTWIRRLTVVRADPPDASDDGGGAWAREPLVIDAAVGSPPEWSERVVEATLGPSGV
jgi:tRNA dimethylallyltransferase